MEDSDQQVNTQWKNYTMIDRCPLQTELLEVEEREGEQRAFTHLLPSSLLTLPSDNLQLPPFLPPSLPQANDIT